MDNYPSKSRSIYVFDIPDGEYCTTKTVSAVHKQRHACYSYYNYFVQFSDLTEIRVTEAEYDYRKKLLMDIEKKIRTVKDEE